MAFTDGRSVHFPGAINSKFTTDLEFVRPSSKTAMPTYRILDQDGVVVDKDRTPSDIPDEEVLKMYTDMLSGRFNPLSVKRSTALI